MDIKEFIKDFADQFDETEIDEFTPTTVYRDLDEWSSLTGLAILNMVGKKYSVKLTASEVKGTETIEDIYNLISSKIS
jgi:acyl carrier protein